ncbi:MAG: type II toxin-antitoxin system HicB family antitoxin [Bryobacteraceae bacterium]|jgi:antitoxin HicB
MISYPVRITREGQAFLAQFPDVPIAHTFGDTKQECLENALDALETAFIALMSDRSEIPEPSRIKRGMDSVTLPALAEAKISLYREMLAVEMRKAELARQLGWHKPQVDRLLDLRHDSRLDQIERAFAALGKRVRIAIEDAA